MDQAAIDAMEAMRNDDVAMPTPTLKKLVTKAVKLAKEIDAIEQHLEAMKSEYNAITTKQLVEEMAQAGMEKFTGVDGSRIEVKDFMSGSLPKEASANKRALDWLDANGGGDLARCTFVFALDKGDDKARAKLAQFAMKAKLPCEESIKVHPQSLYAFVRERLESGHKTPIETLGLYLGKVAKITLPSKGVKLGRKTGKTKKN